MTTIFLSFFICSQLCIARDRVPLIIDTDIGGDFDDSVAVAYAVSRQDVFDIKLILTASWNTTAKALLLAKYLQYMNASHIDIGIGINTSTSCGPQCPWAEGYQFNEYGPGIIYYNGVKQAENIISTYGSPLNPVYIVGIAPLINLGQIFIDNPDYKKITRFIAMSGAIYPPGAEYNVRVNISSSEILYNYTSIIPYSTNICAAPTDITSYYQIYGENYSRFYDAQSWNVIAYTVIQNYQIWYDNGGYKFSAYRPFNVTTATSLMPDPVAMFIASILAENEINNQINNPICNNETIPFIQMDALYIAVNDSGYTIIDNNDNLKIVYEGIEWLPNLNNGTWNLAAYHVDHMLSYGSN